MTTLLKGAKIVNVFTDELLPADVLLRDSIIAGVGTYTPADADITVDVTGKILCPGLIDSHIHVESSMLTPAAFTRAALPHGTTTIIMDSHEIANVCGRTGLEFMLRASEGLPITMYMALPSCVPATPFDENGATLDAASLRPFYNHPRVIALGEVMDYPGVIHDVPAVTDKIRDALSRHVTVNGHAPLLSGRDLDTYLSHGIDDDHECTSPDEAKERISKGQTVMIRQGTAAQDLLSLLPLFDEPWNRHCVLATDDKHPADLLTLGHIDHMVRMAAENGRSPIVAIRMASLQAARHFGLRHVGAIAPGYAADLLVLNDLDTMDVQDVYKAGVPVVSAKVTAPFAEPKLSNDMWKSVLHSFYMNTMRPDHFHLEEKSDRCRVISVTPGSLLTGCEETPIDWTRSNGVDTDRDILKLAVIERHLKTGHIGLGLIRGLGLRKGAIAASIAHDSHNLIVVGTNEEDMALAANTVHHQAGGSVAVADGHILAIQELPVAGLMSVKDAAETAAENENMRRAVHGELGVPEGIEPFMHMAFVSLPVIPDLKMTTLGLVDVNRQERVSLYV